MRTLGLDLGTSSIGWAVIDSSLEYPIIAKGVQVFEKGVGEGKSGEYSLASERTQFRAARRIKQRRKWRKLTTLRILAKEDYCPEISKEDLDNWQFNKVYPQSTEFRTWLQTKTADDKNGATDPYYLRWLAASKKLDLTKQEDRYSLGRAFYHLAQRRGYKSNRLTGDEKDGKVQNTIAALDEEMGDRTLGQFFHEECFGKSKIRGEGHYTSRKHYEAEFDAICEKQNLPQSIRTSLKHAIFFQRPLKSQKGYVGLCVFEPKKRRAPISHPLFEKFRALQLINNIRICPPNESEMRPLTAEEHAQILSWNLTRKKAEKFEKLANQLTPRKAKKTFGVKTSNGDNSSWLFNYRDDAGVAECPTTARFINLFGESWQSEIYHRYKKAQGKTQEQVIDDVWHAMFNFDDEEKLQHFGTDQLSLDEDEAQVYAQPLKQGYGNLSLSAIRKITPFLEQGLIYSHAVFMANMPTLFERAGLSWTKHETEVNEKIGTILEEHRMATASERTINSILKHLIEDNTKDLSLLLSIPANENEMRERIEQQFKNAYGSRNWSEIPEPNQTNHIDEILSEVKARFHPGMQPVEFAKVLTLESRIGEMLHQDYGLNDNVQNTLYHPSAIDIYKKVEDRLGSPRIDSIKNPVFMRTMHRLRAVINELIDEGIVDQNTRVRIEMARDLTTGNERNAIYRYQREREKLRTNYKKAIEDADFTATDSAILKYQLWEEQGKICLYTGEQISCTEFLGDNPIYDIEHTIPRSRRLDGSQSNLTLCNREFNRATKGNKIPAELNNYEDILSRVRTCWSGKIHNLEVSIAKARARGKQAGEKETKDKARQDYHYLQNQRRYWSDKIRNFETPEVPEGFANSQLVDTRIICKYAMLYLKSYFDRVYSLKASGLTLVKDIWELNDKFRGNHIHHGIDAMVAASISPRFYEELANYFHKYERFEHGNGRSPDTPEPWRGFTKFLNEQISREVLIVHHHKENLLKPTFKKLRVRGKVQTNSKGEPIYQRGDSARGSLHKDTYYGKIKPPPTSDNKDPAEVKAVARVRLDKIEPGKITNIIANIVDREVREIVEKNKDKIGKEPIWFNKDKNIQVKKVRAYIRSNPETMIQLKAHRDVSTHEHKRHLYAVNESNYATGLYRGVIKGKSKANWKIVSAIEAVRSEKEGTWESVLPVTDDKGLTLTHVLYSGTQVIFYRETADELKKLPSEILSKRLYRVTAMEGATCKFNHHQTALSDTELKKQSVSKLPPDNETPAPRLRLSLNKCELLVAGIDFKLSNTGNIIWMDSKDA